MKRGQIWKTKVKPVLIVSHDLINKHLHTVIVIPLSEKIYSSPGPEKILINKKLTALTPNLRVINKDRLLEKTGTINQIKMNEVDEALKLVLGMTPL